MQTDYQRTIPYSGDVWIPRPYAVNGFPGLARRAGVLCVPAAQREERGKQAVIPYAVEGFPGLKDKPDHAFEKTAYEKGYAYEPEESGYAFRLYGASY